MNFLLLWYVLRDKRKDDLLDTPVDLLNNWVYYPLMAGMIAWIGFCAYCIYRMATK